MSLAHATSSYNFNLTYGYDARDQLTSVTVNSGNPALAENYAYDDNGNRMLDATNSQSPDGQDNRLQTDGTYNYTYDDEGNRTQRTEIATGQVTEYTWDHRNRLTKVTEKPSATGSATKTVEYAYDVFDRRVSKTVDNDGAGAGVPYRDIYVYDGAHIALEFRDDDASGSNLPELSHHYVHGPAVDMILADEQVTTLTSPGNVLWPLADHLGSVRDLVNGSGGVQNHLVYSSFGKVISESNAAIDHIFGFTGRERDEEAHLTYYRARYYDAETGRFVSKNPIGFNAGDANLYRMVGKPPDLCNRSQWTRRRRYGSDASFGNERA